MSGDVELKYPIAVETFRKTMADNGFTCSEIIKVDEWSRSKFHVEKNGNFVYCFLDDTGENITDFTRYGMNDPAEFIETVNKEFQLNIDPVNDL